MVGWHQVNEYEFEQAPGVGDGQGSLVCCSPWGHKESDMTDWVNWTGPWTLGLKQSFFPPWVISISFLGDCAGSFLLSWLSLGAKSRDYSLVVACGLLIVVASLVTRSLGSKVSGLQCSWHVASVVVVHRLGCPSACGILPGQWSNPGLPHQQEDS